MNRFESLAVFVRVADLGSFAAAARDLGLSPAMVGNHIRALEAWSGAPLVLRTTRRQSLTDAGRAVLAKARALVDGMAELEALADRPDRLTGVLRVGAPIGIGRHHVGPALRAFAADHPDLQVELRLTDTVEDMVQARLDLTVRNRAPPGNEASLIARVVARQMLLLVASPAYVDRAGMPRSLDDLMHHRTVRYSRHGRALGWTFPDDGAIVQIDPPAAFMADDIGTLLDAAWDGAGIALLPEWLVASAIASGTLCRLLPDQPMITIDTHVVRPLTRVPARKVTMAADYLATALRASLAPHGATTSGAA